MKLKSKGAEHIVSWLSVQCAWEKKEKEKAIENTYLKDFFLPQVNCC